MENNNLQHAGIKGMRWGIRRYQNKDGSLTPAGKKRYGDKPFEDDDDDIDEAEVKKRYEEGKKRALQSGSIEEVLKYKGDLTNKELGEVYTRLNYEKSIESLLPKKKTGLDKFSDTMTKVDTIRGGAEKAIGAYNLVAKINNTFSDKRLPVLDGVNRTSSSKSKRDSLIKSKVSEVRAAKKRGDSEAVSDILSDLSYDELKEVYDRLNIEKKAKTNI